MDKDKVMVNAYELFNDGKYPEAAILYEEAIELEPEVKSHYCYLGLCLLFQAQLEEAQMTWWFTIDESDSSKNELVAFLLQAANEFGLNLHRYDMAVSILEAGVGLELKSIYLLSELARFYALSFRYVECIDAAKQY